MYPNSYNDIEDIEVAEGMTSVLVTLRFAMATIFIITLAKWFSRAELALVFVINRFINSFSVGSVVHKRIGCAANQYEHCIG